MVLGLSHAGTSVFKASSPSRRILVATLDGIVMLERLGDGLNSGWRVADRTLQGSHVSSILMPTPGLILAGIFQGGVVASSDDGQTWTPRDNGIDVHDVYSLGSTTLSGRLRLFAGTEPAHIYISDDLGQSWRDVPSLREVPGVPRWTFPAPPHIGHLKQIAIAPDNPAVIYGAIEQGGLLKSIDGGETWREIPGVDDDVHRLVIDPHDSRRMFTVTGVGIYASNDGGENWERRTDEGSIVGGYPDQFTFVPGKPNDLIVTGARDNPDGWFTTHFAGSRMARSRDGGRSWQIVGNGFPAPDQMQASVEAMCLEDRGSSFSLFVGTTIGEVWASDDGAENWTAIARGLAPVSKGAHAHILNAA